MILEIHPYIRTQSWPGLANKLRAIISSMEYCRSNNFKLNVIWDYFYVLFPTILNNPIFTQEKGNRIVGPLYYPIGEENNKEGGFPGDANVNYYDKFFPFCELFNMLIPNDNIKQKIEFFDLKNELINGFGVHLRLTDFQQYSQHNNLYYPTLEDYTNKIDVLLNEQNQFYFTSDDIESYHKIKNRYGSKAIIFENKITNRNLNDNFDYAYIDMILLSKTKFVIGNVHSTFSYHAARIKNLTLHYYDGNEWKLKSSA